MSGSGGPGTAELCSVLDVVSVACDTFLLTSLHLLTHLLTYSLTFGWLYCGSRPAALMVLVLRCTTWIELTSTQGGRRGKASHVSAVHSPIRPVSVSSRLSGTLVRMVQRTSYAAGKEMCSRSGEPMRCAAQLAVNGWCCRSPVPPRASAPLLCAMTLVVRIDALVRANQRSMRGGEKPSCGLRCTSLSRMKMRSYRRVSSGTSTFFQKSVM